MISPSEPMPAMRHSVPVLGGVQAPRVARPLRACGLDAACAPGRGHLSPAVSGGISGGVSDGSALAFVPSITLTGWRGLAEHTCRAQRKHPSC